MSFFHYDDNGYVRDKYDNFKDTAEVNRAVENGDLKRFNCDKFVYDVRTGEEYWADGTRRK